YTGWVDKILWRTSEIDENKLCYTRHEPIGVVGQIIPWNFPLLMFAWQIATRNSIILKPSEFTPLTAIRMCSIIREAGSNRVITPSVLRCLSSSVLVARQIYEFRRWRSGSTLVSRKVMEAVAKSNLKDVTLELGGRAPTL
ncbi:Aldedh-domain-containing protein, partial [Hymenopellis radicata]